MSVPHGFGPYYIKSKGIEEGTYVRFGLTNRLADATPILEIQRLKEPNFDCALKEINFSYPNNYRQMERFLEKDKSQIIDQQVFVVSEEWQKQIVEYLKDQKEILPKKAQELWGVTSERAQVITAKGTIQFIR